VLNVSREATVQEIRTAFRKLTLQYHPDKFTGDKRAEAEKRFQSITEAFNVLSRSDLKDKYDQELSQGGTSEVMDPKEIARRLANKGAQELRAGNLVEALQHLELAVDHDDDCSRAHYFLGVALSKSKPRMREALRHLERAVQLEPNNTTIKAEAAATAMANGMKNRAIRLAQEALSLDPSNAKANDVLAKVESEQTPQTDGILGRFRRKG